MNELQWVLHCARSITTLFWGKLATTEWWQVCGHSSGYRAQWVAQPHRPGPDPSVQLGRQTRVLLRYFEDKPRQVTATYRQNWVTAGVTVVHRRNGMELAELQLAEQIMPRLFASAIPSANCCSTDDCIWLHPYVALELPTRAAPALSLTWSSSLLPKVPRPPVHMNKSAFFSHLKTLLLKQSY